MAFTPSSAAPLRRSPVAMRWARRLAVLVPVLLACVVAAITITALQSRSDSSRIAEVQIGSMRYALQNLLAAPFEASPSAGGSPAYASRLISGDRDTFARIWKSLSEPSSPTEIGQAGKQFATLVPVVWSIYGVGVSKLSYYGPNAAVIDTLQTKEFGIGDRLDDVLQRASSTYARRSVVARRQARFGTYATIVALLLAFVAVFVRAVLARTASERLARALARSESHLIDAQRSAGLGSWEWRPSGVVSWSYEQSVLNGWIEASVPGAISTTATGDLVVPRSTPPTTAEAIALIDPAYRDEYVAAFRTTWETGVPLDHEYAIRGPHGLQIIHCVGRRVVDEHGDAVSMLGTCMDVTERFRRLEAERANTAKDAFLARMSHELRTPLNAILGFGQLLDEVALPDPQGDQVGHVVAAGRHLLALVDEILELSQIASGARAPTMEPVQIQELVNDAVALMTPIALDNRISIGVDSAEAPIWVHADRQRLRQVVLNLLSNAIKYNRDGGRVHLAVSRPDGVHVRLEVVDDGPGIAEELQPRLFTPFDRLGAEATAVTGTGLGLSVSKAFTEAMGGSLTVVSAPQRGTVCTVELDGTDPPGHRIGSGEFRQAA